MIVVADSSPLVVLAKLACFDLLPRVFSRVYVSTEVHREVVVSGAGLPGAAEVAKAQWIEVKQLQNPAELRRAQDRYALGAGELSTILLAKELHAKVVLLDDYKARKLASSEGLEVRGSLGLLEVFYLRGHLTDLRAVRAASDAQLCRQATFRPAAPSVGSSSALRPIRQVGGPRPLPLC